MTEFLDPDKIYSNFINDNISKEEATDLLITFIENSDFHMKRIESLEMIDKIGLRTEKVFKTLENWVVSDEMQVFRAIALKVMVRLFPSEISDTLQWLFNTIKAVNEYKSHFIFAMLTDLLYWSEDNHLKDFKKELIQKIKPIIRNYTQEGVVQSEAVLLALFEMQCGNYKLNKIISENFYQDEITDYLNYTINNAGHIIGIKITCNILFIPRYLYKLNYLEELELPGNYITLIPESIRYLKSLKVLNLSKNYIKSIPKSISTLINLKILNLAHNQIQKIPDSFSLLISLMTLNLGHNKLNLIPDSICLLKNMESLYLCSNNLEKIPDSIGDLNSLKVLDLWNNRIQFLPESIGALHSLEILKLGHNKIQIIPNSISSLQLIQIIDFRFNNVKDLPESLTTSTWLNKLVLEGNKIKNLNISKDR